MHPALFQVVPPAMSITGEEGIPGLNFTPLGNPGNSLPLLYFSPCAYH